MFTAKRGLKPSPIEFAPTARVERIQAKLLRRTVEYAARKSRFYRERLSGVDPADAGAPGLRGLQRLPFTTKEDLRERNFDFLCTPTSRLVDISATSGTSGEPVFIPFTFHDRYGRTGDMARRISLLWGIEPGDLLYLTVTLDKMFSVGFAYCTTLPSIGVGVVRMGMGGEPRQVEVLGRLKPTIVYGIPSFLVSLGEEAVARGLNPKGLGVRALVTTAEPARDRRGRLNRLGARLRALWGAEIFSDYGVSETGSGFGDCVAHAGYHTFPDWVIVEVVDPETGEQLGEGEVGEVVLTTLGVEAMPLIRYRTGDLASLTLGRCEVCGRTSPRLSPILERVDQMVKVRGVKVYPEHISNVVASIEGVRDFLVNVDRRGHCLTVYVNPSPGARRGELRLRVEEEVRGAALVKPRVRLVGASLLKRLRSGGGGPKPLHFKVGGRAS